MSSEGGLHERDIVVLDRAFVPPARPIRIQKTCRMAYGQFPTILGRSITETSWEVVGWGWDSRCVYWVLTPSLVKVQHAVSDVVAAANIPHGPAHAVLFQEPLQALGIEARVRVGCETPFRPETGWL